MIDLNEIEILQVALVHEERARAFYERQARRHGDTPAGDLFAFLAGEEEGHIRKLSARHKVPSFEAGWEERHLPYLIDIDRLAREEGAEAGTDSGTEVLRRGLDIAKKAESHAISFYGQAKTVVEDRDTRELLAELESEEKLHLARIENYLKDL